MQIVILGPGCRNCVTLERRTRDVVADLGVTAEVGKETDYGVIASYGVLVTPGLVIDGEVAVSGRVPTEAELREIIRARAG